MTRPSRGGEIFLIVFGLIFLTLGLFAASTFFLSAAGQTQGNAWVVILVGGTFIIVGGGIVYAAIYGTRKLQQTAAAEQSNPESPWLWRKDWAASRAESKNRNRAIGLWVAAIFADLIAVSLAASTLPKLWRSFDAKIFFPLLFCLVGVILTGMALRASIRQIGRAHV